MKRESTSKESVSQEQRHAMIAEAAYFLALRRGFAPGCEIDDWLEAELQIAGQLGEMPPASEEPEPGGRRKRGPTRDQGRSAS